MSRSSDAAYPPDGSATWGAWMDAAKALRDSSGGRPEALEGVRAILALEGRERDKTGPALEKLGHLYRDVVGIDDAGAAEEWAGIVEEARRPAQTTAPATPVERMRARLLTITQLRDRPRPEYLLDGIIPERSTGMLFGPSGWYKSFLALAWSLCIGEGLKWEADGAYDVKGGAVVYVAGEGADGFPARVEAWEESNHHKIGAGVLWYPQPVNLMERGTIETFAEAVAPHQPRLMWFDTLAKCAVGGDENSAKDMGIVADSMGFLVRELGCSAAVVHHSKKDGSAYRGSSALHGNVDWAVETKPGPGGITVCSEKQKDAAPFANISLRAHLVAESLCLKGVALTSTGTDGTDTLLELVCQVSAIEAVPGAQLRTMAEKELKLSARSYYRALNVLVAKGFVLNVGTERRGLYRASTLGISVVSARCAK